MVVMTEPGPWSPLPPPPPAGQGAGGWWSPPPGPPTSPWGPPQPPTPRPPGRGPASWTAVMILVVASAVLGGAVGGLIVHHSDRSGLVGSVTIGSFSSRGAVVEKAPGSVAAVAARILPSVVSIQVKTSSGGDTGS